MEIFGYNDYKPWLLKSLRDGKAKSGLQTALAKQIGCRPAYLSRILNESAHLSLEQASDVADFFSLSTMEKSYLIALVGEKRTDKGSLKSYWTKRKQEAYTDSMELKNRVSLEQHLTESQMMTYYSSWHYSAIHIAVGIPQLQTIDDLARYFQISKAHCQRCLKFLQDTELIKKEGIRYSPFKSKLHLDKKSPLLQTHHLNWKHKIVEMMQDPKAKDLNYMSVISISKKDFDILRENFLQAIEKARDITHKSKDEIVACYALDLFQLDRASQDGDSK